MQFLNGKSPPSPLHLPFFSIIFNALVDWWLHKFSYQPGITKLAKSLVSASLDVYELAQKELLPTPTKSHYTFNLRDVSKVFQASRSKHMFAWQACHRPWWC